MNITFVGSYFSPVTRNSIASQYVTYLYLPRRVFQISSILQKHLAANLWHMLVKIQIQKRRNRILKTVNFTPAVSKPDSTSKVSF